MGRDVVACEACGKPVSIVGAKPARVLCVGCADDDDGESLIDTVVDTAVDIGAGLLDSGVL